MSEQKEIKDLIPQDEAPVKVKVEVKDELVKLEEEEVPVKNKVKAEGKQKTKVKLNKEGMVPGKRLTNKELMALRIKRRKNKK